MNIRNYLSPIVIGTGEAIHTLDAAAKAMFFRESEERERARRRVVKLLDKHPPDPPKYVRGPFFLNRRMRREWGLHTKKPRVSIHTAAPDVGVVRTTARNARKRARK